MKVYHSTIEAAAATIDRDGFQDATGKYLTLEYTGVWVSDPLLSEPDFWVPFTAWYEIEAPEAELALFEWIEKGKPYREWLVPAKILNTFPRRRLCQKDVDEIEERRFLLHRLRET